jgi:hypothetical protein
MILRRLGALVVTWLATAFGWIFSGELVRSHGSLADLGQDAYR